MDNLAPQRQPHIGFPMPLAKDIVEKMYAVGDEMRAEVRKNLYVTNNHLPSKFWDVFNTNVCEALDSLNCTSAIRRRGNWDMVIAFCESHGFLFTFMRERRFKELRKKIEKRKNMTYIDMFVREFNHGLSAPEGQMSFFPRITVEFSDEADLSERVERLLNGFPDEDALINHYIIVLFDCDEIYELRRVTAVLVDPYLDTVDEENWSQYIPVKETSVAEKVSDATAPGNNPSRGLSLKPKALRRKKSQEAKSPTADITQEEEIPPSNEAEGDLTNE